MTIIFTMKIKIGEMFEIEAGELKEFIRDWKSAKNFTILSLIFIFLYFGLIKYVLGSVQFLHCIIVGIPVLIGIGLWLNGRRVPLNRRDRIGILIWVDSEDDKDSIQIKKDFTKSFIELLKSSKHSSLYNVVFLDRFHGKSIRDLLELDRLVTLGA